MSSIKIKKYEFNHIPWVALVNEFDCPVCPHASAYLSTLTSQAFNTRLRKAAELLFVLEYFQRKEINLVERVRSGELITLREYSQFQDASACKKVADKDSNKSAVVRQVSDKFLRNALSANVRQLSLVSNETQAGRLKRLSDYLKLLFEYFHDAKGNARGITDRYEKLVATIKLDEESLGKNETQRSTDPTQSTIPNDIFLRMLEMIHPLSPNNPFKGARFRNYLIVSLFRETGIRRGALAKLKISDLILHGTFDQIRIYKSGNDATETRREKGRQKTKAHLATVPSTLLHQIKYYIDNVRSKIPDADKHEFIFVSEKNSRGTLGKELSLKSINAIFAVLSEVLNFHIHPHLLRHKWNEVFDEKGSQLEIDQRVVEEARNYAMGWTADSNMSAIYNEKRLAEKAREISLGHQTRTDRQK